MINILHIMAGADAGGISSVVLNYYRFIDRSKFHFDIAVTSDTVGLNGQRLIDLGANIYHIPMKSEGIALYENAICKLLTQKHYDVIHVHENETSYIALKLAKKMKIKIRIAHAHTTAPYSTLKNEVRRLSGNLFNPIYATKIIGCGELAGKRIFGAINMKRKKAMVLPNAIDTELFSFNVEEREQMRKALNIEDKFVIGMVGRIAQQKNNIYAISIFKEILKSIPQSVLVIAGNGPDEPELLEKIKTEGVEDNVKFLGRRGDVEKLYQAFDVFFMPSLFEGFPVAAVEAMATGLPVLLSDTITRELSFGSAVRYLPLNKINKWVKAATEFTDDKNRENRVSEIRDNGLDIRNTAKLLEQVYSK